MIEEVEKKPDIQKENIYLFNIFVLYISVNITPANT
jgi:hypothetical protein